jgi:hypothetical protein
MSRLFFQRINLVTLLNESSQRLHITTMSATTKFTITYVSSGAAAAATVQSVVL